MLIYYLTSPSVEEWLGQYKAGGLYCCERRLFPSQVSVNLTLTTSAQTSNGCLVASVIDFAQFLENIASSFLRPSYRRNRPVKLGKNRRKQPETVLPSN